MRLELNSREPGVVKGELWGPAEVTEGRSVLGSDHDVSAGLSEDPRRDGDTGSGLGSGFDKATNVVFAQVAIVPESGIQKERSFWETSF